MWLKLLLILRLYMHGMNAHKWLHRKNPMVKSHAKKNKHFILHAEYTFCCSDSGLSEATHIMKQHG